MAAQRASLVLFSDGAPPILDNARLFVEGMEDVDGFETVTDPAAADAILVRLDAPFEKGRGSVIGEYFHGGTLAFPQETLDRLASYAAQAPLFISVFLERPAIVGPLVDLGATVIGKFGASDRIVLDAFCGRTPITRRLPFDITSSMEAVEASREDVPFATVSPRFKAGFGLNRDVAPLHRRATPSALSRPELRWMKRGETPSVA